MKKITLSVAALLIAGMSYGQTQCKGMTKSNTQCKNITKKENNLCHHHDSSHVSANSNQGETVICSGTTKKNTNCKNRTKDKSGLCQHHRKNN